MLQTYNLIIGIIFLSFGYPLGKLLARFTSEELKSGQKYFKIIIFISLIGGLIGLILQNDIIMFSMFFIAIVTSQSLKNNKRKNKK